MEIDSKKMKLINECIELSKGRTSEEILPLLMAVSKKSKQMGISFTKEETLYLVEQFKSSLSEAEKSKIDMLLKLMM